MIKIAKHMYKEINNSDVDLRINPYVKIYHRIYL